MVIQLRENVDLFPKESVRKSRTLRIVRDVRGLWCLLVWLSVTSPWSGAGQCVSHCQRGEAGQEDVGGAGCFRLRSMNRHLLVSEGVTAIACVFILDPKHQFYLGSNFPAPPPTQKSICLSSVFLSS